MDPDRAKKGPSRIPQLTGPPRQTTRRIELSRPVDNVRPKAATKPAAPVRSKPASRLGATAPKQGASLEAKPMARKPATVRALHTAPSAPVSREGSLLRKAAPDRDALLSRQGSGTRQSMAASSTVPASRSGTGLAKMAAAKRPSSSASNRSTGGVPTNKWNASVARTPSTGAKLGLSGRFGASREAALSKKAAPVRDAAGARLQPNARPASVGKQEAAMRQPGGLRRPVETPGEGSAVAGQPTEGLRKVGPFGHRSALQQHAPGLRRAAQEGSHGVGQGKLSSGLRGSLKAQEASQQAELSGRLDGSESKSAPQQQAVSRLRGMTSTRVQATSQVREPSFRSTWADPASSDSFRSMLTSPGRSAIRSPDRSSSISTDEISDTPNSGEQPLSAAELMRNSTNPFVIGPIEGSGAGGSRPKAAYRAVKRGNGQALSAQHLASRCSTEPSAHPDLDAETSFTGSEQSNVAFTPSCRNGEEETRRRAYRGRSCVSVCSEGGFSDELAMRQDSRLSFALESVPSTYGDSDEDLPAGRHSVSKNSTQSSATGELSLKDMNGSHIRRPKSVDCLKGNQGATAGSFPSRNGGSSPFGTSPLKMPSLGPAHPVRLSIDLSPTGDNSAPSAQSEGDSKSASLLSIGSVTSLPVRTDDGIMEQLHKEIEALKADNSALTAQVKDLEAKTGAVAKGVVSGLKQDVKNLQTEKSKLLQAMEAMKLDKQRIQAELAQSQEEVKCVLSETQDADAEVQVYLKRLEEAHGRKELLERDLQWSEGELSKLQAENANLQKRLLELESAAEENKRLSDDNMQLKEKLEAEAQVKRDGLDESHQAVNKLAKELHLVQETLSSVLEEKASLIEQLARSPKAPVEQQSSGDESPDASASGATVQKVTQLQDALSLALEVNRCMKERMEKVSDRNSTATSLDSDFAESQAEMDKGTMRKVKELQQALDLALEAQDLLEKRVAEHEEVHPGLERLSEDLQNLKIELDEERSRAQDERESLQAMIQELENDNRNKMNDLQQAREELSAAVDARRAAEALLHDERAASEGLKDLLENRPAKNGQDFVDLESAAQRGLGGSPALGSALDVDPSGGSPLSAAKLRAPAEFGDEAQLRRAAVAAVTRLEEMEQELSNAVKEKCDLAQQMVDISVASQELQKVVLETAQITSEMSISKERRGGKARGAPPLDGAALEASGADFDVDLSGASDAEDVSIPAGQLRGMRNEMRRALQEKISLEAELAERARKTAGISDELKGLQAELKAALAMKEDLSCRFQEHQGAKAQLGEENVRLVRELEKERAANAAVEDAVGGLYRLCKEVESAADIEAVGRSRDDEFPASLPEAVVHITGRVREGICALASRGRASPPEAPAGRDWAGSEPGTPNLGAKVRLGPPMGSDLILGASRAVDLQVQMPELQEVLQEQACMAGPGRPGSQTGSPMAASRGPRFGYMPGRELQRVMSEGGSRWREMGAVQAVAPAPDGLTQKLMGLQSRAQELETSLLEVKIENAELKRAIDQVHGIARGKSK